MRNKFELVSKYKPAGDQPKAIKELVDGINNGDDAQTLLGITGSGKTFTIYYGTDTTQTSEEIREAFLKQINATNLSDIGYNSESGVTWIFKSKT